jgi:hypothetical protein
MAGSPLRDSLLLAFWLIVFIEAFLISIREVIRDHCRRIRIKKKLKLRGRK